MAMKVTEQVLSEETLLDNVKNFVVARGYVQVHEIQRYFNLGYQRACRLLQQLEYEKIITPANQEQLRFSLVITLEQQKWWDQLPIIWKKIFTGHIYHGDKLFTPAKQFYEPVAEAEFRQPTDLTRVFALEEIGFYKGKGLVTLPDLSRFYRLKYLDIRHQQIEDIRGLANCISLEQVYLPYNRIQDITPLFSLPHLRELNLSGNPIANQQVLTDLTEQVVQRQQIFEQVQQAIFQVAEEG